MIFNDLIYKICSAIAQNLGICAQATGGPWVPHTVKQVDGHPGQVLFNSIKKDEKYGSLVMAATDSWREYEHSMILTGQAELNFICKARTEWPKAENNMLVLLRIIEDQREALRHYVGMKVLVRNREPVSAFVSEGGPTEDAIFVDKYLARETLENADKVLFENFREARCSSGSVG